MSALTQAQRQHWIGASESASLFGVGYKTHFQLWQEKKGILESPFISGQRVVLGSALESGIAAAGMEIFGIKYEKSNGYTPHPTVGQMGASLDYIQYPCNVPVEIKNVDYWVFKKGWLDDDGQIVVPPHIQIQVLHQMACTGADMGIIIACAGGSELHKIDIERHQPWIDKIESRVDAFWQSIRENSAPEPTSEHDWEAMVLLRQTVKKSFIDMSDNDYLYGIVKEYSETKKLEKRLNQLRGEILWAIGEHSNVTVGDFIINSSGGNDKPRRMTIKEDRG